MNDGASLNVLTTKSLEEWKVEPPEFVTNVKQEMLEEEAKIEVFPQFSGTIKDYKDESVLKLSDVCTTSELTLIDNIKNETVKEEPEEFHITDESVKIDEEPGIKEEVFSLLDEEVKIEEDTLGNYGVTEPALFDETSSTDSAEESYIATLSPPRRKKGHLDIRTKELIVKMYGYELENSPELVVKQVMKKVANKVGVCVATVFKTVREYRTAKAFRAPRTNRNRTKTIDKVDDSVKNTIRGIVRQFFDRNELPTIDKVLSEVNGNPDLPNYKRGTFYKLLKQLGFKFQGRGFKSGSEDTK